MPFKRWEIVSVSLPWEKVASHITLKGAKSPSFILNHEFDPERWFLDKFIIYWCKQSLTQRIGPKGSNVLISRPPKNLKNMLLLLKHWSKSLTITTLIDLSSHLLLKNLPQNGLLVWALLVLSLVECNVPPHMLFLLVIQRSMLFWIEGT